MVTAAASGAGGPETARLRLAAGLVGSRVLLSAGVRFGLGGGRERFLARRRGREALASEGGGLVTALWWRTAGRVGSRLRARAWVWAWVWAWE